VLTVLALAAIWKFGVPWIQLTLNTVSTDGAYLNGHVTFVAVRQRHSSALSIRMNSSEASRAKVERDITLASLAASQTDDPQDALRRG
jgi:hypothetical protein